MANTIDILGDDAVTDSIIDGSITELVDDQIETVYDNVFYSCANLVSIELPKVRSIYGYAFYGCTNLTSVVLPACETLRASVFRECKSLVSIDLPVCREIGSYAFLECYALTKVILRNTSRVATLYNSPGFRTTTIIYVPDALVDDYKSATNWSAFADRIKGLSELPA